MSSYLIALSHCQSDQIQPRLLEMSEYQHSFAGVTVQGNISASWNAAGLCVHGAAPHESPAFADQMDISAPLC